MADHAAHSTQGRAAVWFTKVSVIALGELLTKRATLSFSVNDATAKSTNRTKKIHVHSKEQMLKSF